MGQRASDTRGVTFEDVRVPKEVSLLDEFRSGYFSVHFENINEATWKTYMKI